MCSGLDLFIDYFEKGEATNIFSNILHEIEYGHVVSELSIHEKYVLRINCVLGR